MPGAEGARANGRAAPCKGFALAIKATQSLRAMRPGLAKARQFPEANGVEQGLLGARVAMPMATKQCMIQVAGTTYRIQAEYARHVVFRLSDDRNVGAFEHRPALRVLASDIAPAELLDVARAALRTGRLPWARADQSHERTVQRRDHAARTRRRSATRTLASLLAVLWPSA
jgi:hypothetical protein